MLILPLLYHHSPRFGEATTTETTDYRRDKDVDTIKLLGTALIHYARAYRDWMRQGENRYGDSEQGRKTWIMGCAEADALVSLYEGARTTGELDNLPNMPNNLWANESILVGAGVYHNKNVVAWDNHDDGKGATNIRLVHAQHFQHTDDVDWKSLVKLNDTIFINNDLDDDNVQLHFDLKHHPHPKYESSHGVSFNDEGMSFVLLFLFIRVAKTIFSHFS